MEECAELSAGDFGAVEPGEEKALGRPQSSLPVPEGACKRPGAGVFTRAWSDRTRGNGFKLKKGRYRQGRNSSL